MGPAFSSAPMCRLQDLTSTTKRKGEVKINEANFLRKVCLGKRIRKHEKHGGCLE